MSKNYPSQKYTKLTFFIGFEIGAWKDETGRRLSSVMKRLGFNLGFIGIAGARKTQYNRNKYKNNNRKKRRRKIIQYLAAMIQMYSY